MSDGWVPLRVREDEAATAQFRGPYEGVPEWLKSSLWRWLYGSITRGSKSGFEQERSFLSFITRAQNSLHAVIPGVTGQDVADHLAANDERFLDVTDFYLFENTWDLGERASLAQLLLNAGSVWTVVEVSEGKYGLERRVREAERKRAEGLASRGTAGDHIRKSWNALYGRAPNASVGYSEAIKAVEAVGADVVSPLNARATLGTMIRDAKAAPQKWATRLSPPTMDSVHVVIGMMELLWTAQHGRHGTSDPGATRENTVEQAQDALNLALTLVHLFESGGIAVIAAP